MNWTLVALNEPIKGQTIQIDRDLVIGRHQQADVILQAAHISRRHAALLLKEDGRQLWIQDLNSSNGTFVNGERITEQQLKHRDEIHFENIRFQILAVARVAAEMNTEESEEVELTTSTDVAAKSIVAEPTASIEKVVPSDEGMRTLEERSEGVQVTRDGMPTNIGIPKPAPIPEHVNVEAVVVEPKPTAVDAPQTRVQHVEETKKNAKVGMVTLFVLLILVIALVIFFLHGSSS